MGHSVIPRDVACCEVTVNLPSFPATAAAKGNDRDSIFVVNDLTQHPDLQHRAYVTGRPHARFYAGVPITTSSGVNIGAYCILDDKPRDGVSQQELVFLRDMSQTVMTHLETVLALYERQQSSQMVAGLGDFVRSASKSSRDDQTSSMGSAHTNGTAVSGSNMAFELSSPITEYHIPDALLPNGRQTPRTPALMSSRSLRDEYFDKRTVSIQTERVPDSTSMDVTGLGRSAGALPSRPDESSVSQPETDIQDHQPVVDAWRSQKSTRVVNPGSVTRPPLLAKDPNKGFRGAYQRAAEILCGCLGVDGVAFLDASVGTFGGLTESEGTETSESSTDEGEQSAAAATQVYLTNDNQDSSRDMKICSILGCAQSIRSKPDSDDTKETQPTRKLTEAFLRALLRRHPKGHVWTFDERGSSHSEDDSSTDNDDAADTGMKTDVQPPITRSRKSGWKERRNDGKILQSMFPGARCIALHGIWDNIRRRWMVGSLFWAMDPLRILSADSEMKFVAAFCDIIVAETRRLEVEGSDEAKSDFISTLSHELRSPLHGILGSNELLAGLQLDSVASTLVEQINTCGQTLLEIIDHLLDFANLRKKRLKNGENRINRTNRKRDQSASPQKDTLEQDEGVSQTTVALDDLTEDAIISTVYSFCYRRRLEHHSHVPVILDIDHSDGADWRCELATGGWRRICMNLVVNALKYTPSGFIRITLNRRTRVDGRHFDAVLSVADSGKGMSKEFQRNHLFRDFSQEDNLSKGLGLGMHMVARMVHAMRGKIEVTSDQNGAGTRVTVSIPLKSNRDPESHTPTDDHALEIGLTGIRVGMVADLQTPPTTREESLNQSASTMTAASISKICQHLGAEVIKSHEEPSRTCDVTTVVEAGFAGYLESLREFRDASVRPLAVICTNAVTAQLLRESWTKDDLRLKVVAEFIALPCGARQISRTIRAVLQQQNNLGEANGAQLASANSSMTSEPFPENDTAQSRTATHTVPEHVVEAHKVDVQRQHLSPTAPRIDNFIINGAGVTTPSMLSSTSKPVLLLVDDNNINLRLLVTYAKKREYAYYEAINGQLAVDAYQMAHRRSYTPSRHDAIIEGGPRPTCVPNIIILDINMPIMDGYRAAQQIRFYEKKYQLKPSRIIAVTALQSEAAQVEAFGSGFDMFLSKPIRLKDLTKIIEAER